MILRFSIYSIDFRFLIFCPPVIIHPSFASISSLSNLPSKYERPFPLQVVVGLFTKGEEQWKGKKKIKVISHTAFEVQRVVFNRV
jgi:hypothetical protein